MTYKRVPMIALGVLSALIACYWLLIASDRYLSEAHIMVHRTGISSGQSFDISNLISGVDSGSRSDNLILKDYLESVEVLVELNKRLNLIEKFSGSEHDVFSRISASDPTPEDMVEYFQRRIHVNYDEYTGVLVLKVEAFDPETSKAIVQEMLAMGSDYINETAQKLVESQVDFLVREVDQYRIQSLEAQNQVIEFQNKYNLLSPTQTSATLTAIISTLEGQRAELESKRQELSAYLVPNHPNIVMINQQIAAINAQIKKEQGKLTTDAGGALNAVSEEFVRLQSQAEFKLSLYKSALVALETARLEAARTIKTLTIVREPNLPVASVEPRRWYNTLVWIIGLSIFIGLGVIISSVIKDHRV